MMTDEEILEAAERIKRRRGNERRLDALSANSGVMIRWNIPGSRPGQASYTSVDVTADEVRSIVESKIRPLIEADQSPQDDA